MTDTADLAAFRAEVRAFLAESLTPELARAGRRATSVFAHPDHSIAWQKILTAKGWGAIDWPVEYGGTGWARRTTAGRSPSTSSLSSAAGAMPPACSASWPSWWRKRRKTPCCANGCGARR